MYINNLITGTMTLGSSGGSSSGHADTRFTLQGGTVESYDIIGTLDLSFLLENEFIDGPSSWTKTIISIDIGNTVTAIENSEFAGCTTLQSVTIPDGVTGIGDGVFSGCSGLTSLTFQGKTMEQVQDIEDGFGYGTKFYPWGIEDTSIINVA